MAMARGKHKQPIQINSVAEKMKVEGQCRLCGRLDRGKGARELSRHRLVPGRHGGEYIVANVIPLCRRCHDDVEAQDPVARRMLRPKLWPMEVAHALKRLGEQWFDLMYPKPAQASLRMSQVEILLGMKEEPVQVSPHALEGLGARGLRRAARGKWNPDTAQIASSEKSSARLRDMKIAITSRDNEGSYWKSKIA